MGKIGFRDSNSELHVSQEVTGGGSVAFGVDPADNDSFKMTVSSATGAIPTTDPSFIMTTGGQRTLPLQSAFFAYLANNLTNVTGNDVIATAALDTELFDINSDYDLMTNTFTAPVTGKYRFMYGAVFTNLVGVFALQGCSLLATYNAGTLLYLSGAARNGTTMANASSQLGLSGSFFASMTQGDTMVFQVRTQNGTQTIGLLGDATDPKTFFCGFLNV